MDVIRLDSSRQLIREEILDYFELHSESFTISQPEPYFNVQVWIAYITQKGKELDIVIEEIFKRLENSDRMKSVKIPAFDSGTASAFTHYSKTLILMKIYEEIMELIRAGILLRVNLGTKLPSYEVTFAPNQGDRRIPEKIFLTEYGEKFIKNRLAIPYYAERYITRLAQVAEPDEELKGYLLEGFACMRAELPRAAAIILRLAAEHMLEKLIQSTVASIEESRRTEFESKIRSYKVRIEARADTLFKRLESDERLRPPEPLKGAMSNQLVPAFHVIRDLGGRAAHLSEVIQMEDVRDAYSLFGNSVYKVIIGVVTYHNNLLPLTGSTRPPASTL
jgi:hypothetical protein